MTLEKFERLQFPLEMASFGIQLTFCLFSFFPINSIYFNISVYFQYFPFVNYFFTFPFVVHSMSAYSKKTFPAVRGHYKTYAMATIDWIDVFSRIRDKYSKQSILAKSLGIKPRSLSRLYSNWTKMSSEDQFESSSVQSMVKGKRGGWNRAFSKQDEADLAFHVNHYISYISPISHSSTRSVLYTRTIQYL